MQDLVYFLHPLTKPELGLLHSVPFYDTEHLGRSASSSIVILGDGGYLLSSPWGGDGVELVSFLIGYVRVFVV